MGFTESPDLIPIKYQVNNIGISHCTIECRDDSKWVVCFSEHLLNKNGLWEPDKINNKNTEFETPELALKALKDALGVHKPIIDRDTLFELLFNKHKTALFGFAEVKRREYEQKWYG